MVHLPRAVSRLRSPRLTSQLGLMLGVAFAICLLTGYLSHAIQHPPGWFFWPPRPVGLYRVTQGLHVATGIAIVPLLGAKIWSVYPKLFRWPPARDVAHGLERLSLALLVAAAGFQVLTGLLNIARWYAPMGFFFTVAHFWTAWIAAGAIAIHIGVKLPVIRRALTAKVRPAPADDGWTRRGFLATVGAAIGVVTVATVGQTVRPLAGISVLAPRDPRVGVQGVPVNGSAAAAGVRDRALHSAYQLEVIGPSGTKRLSLADLTALPQRAASLPITCVEGWSADAVWTGVRLRDLVALVGGGPDDTVTVESLQENGPYRLSTVEPPHARDPLTLVALRLHGEPLDLDHGYPCRLIAPNRPGVLQTKWLARITVGVA
ncbi:DMSO/TMAO reductase YedYZ molybdopterin-dependent catalytic subunit [Hamadaea flava]|uniref:Molybdopterin-dependent oxidoreductase n=1 Tax=Hamadaea flava TaxID=1742688 RepID=A0ABV8LYF3_9ACTN|nr:molybdopterin-dependent oxidoreductase [Hamadaea flava]MCP2329033.1 DMSO/TMAO reductase YedYZ molybdopterin-dependent catalytic subunit [Hamadaea flava]